MAWIPLYIDTTTPEEMVRDFIAGMTDAYFLRLAKDLLIPEKLPTKFNQ